LNSKDVDNFLSVLFNKYSRYLNVQRFKAYWLRDAPAVQNSTILHSSHTVFMFFVFTSEERATSAPYDIN